MVDFRYLTFLPVNFLQGCLFINRGGNIIAGDGIVRAGVKELRPQAWRAESKRVCCWKHKGLTVTLLHGPVPRSGGITI